MKSTIGLRAVALSVVLMIATGCQSRAVSNDPDDANAVIDRAVAHGADIPPDKRGVVLRMFRLNEEDLVLGLHTFAELSGGRYPTNLDTRSTLKQVETDRLGSSTPDLSKAAKERMLQDIFFASAFYEKLRQEGRDPQYHGDTVRRQDADKVLLSWTESGKHRRVVLGNLSVCTLTPERLAQLEQ